ncbi:MAG: hypothetical protein HOQ05_05635 [Corynebacteriales bacterium]|nr:hypothetical protein [Mycobacteriales bacterium]
MPTVSQELTDFSRDLKRLVELVLELPNVSEGTAAGIRSFSDVAARLQAELSESLNESRTTQMQADGLTDASRYLRENQEQLAVYGLNENLLQQTGSLARGAALVVAMQQKLGIHVNDNTLGEYVRVLGELTGSATRAGLVTERGVVVSEETLRARSGVAATDTAPVQRETQLLITKASGASVSAVYNPLAPQVAWQRNRNDLTYDRGFDGEVTVAVETPQLPRVAPSDLWGHAQILNRYGANASRRNALLVDPSGYAAEFTVGMNSNADIEVRIYRGGTAEPIDQITRTFTGTIGRTGMLELNPSGVKRILESILEQYKDGAPPLSDAELLAFYRERTGDAGVEYARGAHGINIDQAPAAELAVAAAATPVRAEEPAPTPAVAAPTPGAVATRLDPVKLIELQGLPMAQAPAGFVATSAVDADTRERVYMTNVGADAVVSPDSLWNLRVDGHHMRSEPGSTVGGSGDNGVWALDNVLRSVGNVIDPESGETRHLPRGFVIVDPRGFAVTLPVPAEPTAEVSVYDFQSDEPRVQTIDLWANQPGGPRRTFADLSLNELRNALKQALPADDRPNLTPAEQVEFYRGLMGPVGEQLIRRVDDISYEDVPPKGREPEPVAQNAELAGPATTVLREEEIRAAGLRHRAAAAAGALPQVGRVGTAVDAPTGEELSAGAALARSWRRLVGPDARTQEAMREHAALISAAQAPAGQVPLQHDLQARGWVQLDPLANADSSTAAWVPASQAVEFYAELHRIATAENWQDWPAHAIKQGLEAHTQAERAPVDGRAQGTRYQRGPLGADPVEFAPPGADQSSVVQQQPHAPSSAATTTPQNQPSPAQAAPTAEPLPLELAYHGQETLPVGIVLARLAHQFDQARANGQNVDQQAAATFNTYAERANWIGAQDGETPARVWVKDAYGQSRFTLGEVEAADYYMERIRLAPRNSQAEAIFFAEQRQLPSPQVRAARQPSGPVPSAGAPMTQAANPYATHFGQGGTPPANRPR